MGLEKAKATDVWLSEIATKPLQSLQDDRGRLPALDQ
jgi:hypothetical protein